MATYGRKRHRYLSTLAIFQDIDSDEVGKGGEPGTQGDRLMKPNTNMPRDLANATNLQHPRQLCQEESDVDELSLPGYVFPTVSSISGALTNTTRAGRTYQDAAPPNNDNKRNVLTPKSTNSRMFRRGGRSRSPHKLKISAPTNPTKGGVPLDHTDADTDKLALPKKQVALAVPGNPGNSTLLRSSSFSNFFKHGFSDPHSDHESSDNLLAINPEIVANIDKLKRANSADRLSMAPPDAPVRHQPILSKVKSAITDRFPHSSGRKRAMSMTSSDLLTNLWKNTNMSKPLATPLVPQEVASMQEELLRQAEETLRVNSSPKLSRVLKGTTPTLDPPIYSVMHNSNNTRSETTPRKRDTYHHYVEQSVNGKSKVEQAPIGLGLDFEEEAAGSDLEFEQAPPKKVNLPPHRPESAFLAFDFSISPYDEDVEDNPSQSSNDAAAPQAFITASTTSNSFVSRFDPWESGLSQHANVMQFAEPPASYEAEIQKRKGAMIVTKPFGSKFDSTEAVFHKQASLMQVSEPSADLRAETRKRKDVQALLNALHIPPYNPHKSGSWPPPNTPAFPKARAHHRAPMQKRDGMLLPKAHGVLSKLKDSAMDWQLEDNAEFSIRSPLENITNGAQHNFNIPTITLKRASDVPRGNFGETTEATGSPKAKKGKARLSTSPQHNILDDWYAKDAMEQLESSHRPSTPYQNKPSLRETTFSTLIAERGDSPPLPPKPTSPSTTARLRRIKSKKRQSLPRAFRGLNDAGHITWAVQMRAAEEEGVGQAVTIGDEPGIGMSEWEEGSPPSDDNDELGPDWEWDEDAVGVAL